MANGAASRPIAGKPAPTAGGVGQGLMLVSYGQWGRFAAHRRQASSYRCGAWLGIWGLRLG